MALVLPSWRRADGAMPLQMMDLPDGPLTVMLQQMLQDDLTYRFVHGMFQHPALLNLDECAPACNFRLPRLGSAPSVHAHMVHACQLTMHGCCCCTSGVRRHMHMLLIPLQGGSARRESEVAPHLQQRQRQFPAVAGVRWRHVPVAAAACQQAHRRPQDSGRLNGCMLNADASSLLHARLYLLLLFGREQKAQLLIRLYSANRTACSVVCGPPVISLYVAVQIRRDWAPRTLWMTSSCCAWRSAAWLRPLQIPACAACTSTPAQGEPHYRQTGTHVL